MSYTTLTKVLILNAHVKTQTECSYLVTRNKFDIEIKSHVRNLAWNYQTVTCRSVRPSQHTVSVAYSVGIHVGLGHKKL